MTIQNQLIRMCGRELRLEVAKKCESNYATKRSVIGLL